MAISILDDKSVFPNEKTLSNVLGQSSKLWDDIKKIVLNEYPEAGEEWKHSGKNYGWGFRLKDKKRVIVYLTPLENSFYVSLVFGEKATKEALASDISDEIKDIINSAKVYAEGRGIRLFVDKKEIIPDIKKLVKIKLEH